MGEKDSSYIKAVFRDTYKRRAGRAGLGAAITLFLLTTEMACVNSTNDESQRNLASDSKTGTVENYTPLTDMTPGAFFLPENIESRSLLEENANTGATPFSADGYVVFDSPTPPAT